VRTAQVEGVEQADRTRDQIAQRVRPSTRLVADRSAGVAVVVADDEPGACHEALAELLPREHRGGRSAWIRRIAGSAGSPKVWTHKFTPLARTILSSDATGRPSGPGMDDRSVWLLITMITPLM
jgi:hypothetical protein